MADSKEPACNMGDLSLFPGSGRFPREENDNSLQDSYLEISMNRGYSPWSHDWATNTFTFTNMIKYEYLIKDLKVTQQKEMSYFHSSLLYKESWAQKNWWFWTVAYESPLTTRRSNQSILKEISPGCSLEGLMLKPKLQYFGHLMWRANTFEKTLMLGKIEGRRKRGRQRMRWLDGITDSMDMSFSKL